MFRFFTQSDIEVQNNYLERYAQVFRPTEIKMMLAAFANMETVHIVAYALLLETIGMPETEFAAFMDYQAMRDKHDYMQRFGVQSEGDILRTLAMFGGFTEGLQLFASFAILLNFPRHNKMRGMGQIVSWSVRDESLHCEGIMRLFHAFAAETGALTKRVREDIVECARTVVGLEDRFIDLAFELGPITGLDAEQVKTYIRYVADWRLQQLGNRVGRKNLHVGAITILEGKIGGRKKTTSKTHRIEHGRVAVGRQPLAQRRPRPPYPPCERQYLHLLRDPHGSSFGCGLRCSSAAS